MGRRRAPASGPTTARSDKPFKVAGHGRERRTVRQGLRATHEDDALPSPHGFGDPRAAPSDGKTRWGGHALATRWQPKCVPCDPRGGGRWTLESGGP